MLRHVVSSAWVLGSSGVERKVISTAFTPTGTSVALRFLASPINHTDVAYLKHKTVSRLQIPASKGSPQGVVGVEGVAIVEDVGSDSRLKVGDWVVPRRFVGSWQTHAVVDDADVIRVPREGLAPEVVSLMAFNYLAATQILTTGGALGAGQTVLINGASSTFGRILAQVAKLQGYNTIGVVSGRNIKPNVENNIHRLKHHGFDVVVHEDWVGERLFERATADLPAPRLGVDLTGGFATARQIQRIANGGHFVVVGNLYQEPLTIMPQTGVTVTGYSHRQWLEGTSLEALEETAAYVANLLRSERLSVPIERHDVEQLDAALARFRGRNRFAKPVFVHEPPRAIAPSAKELADVQEKQDALEWGLFQGLVKPETEGDPQQWWTAIKQANASGRDNTKPESRSVVFSPTDFVELRGSVVFPQSPPASKAEDPSAPRLTRYVPADVERPTTF